MSEKKRFILAEDSNGLYSIFDTEDKEDEPLIYGARFGTEKIVDLLNEQQTIIKSKDKQLERLYNYFQDYLKDEMSGNAFSEMWDFVKEDERWNDE